MPCLLSTLALALAVPFSALAEFSYPTIGEVERLDSVLDELIAPDASIEVVASGFVWSEGPLWLPEDGGSLIFSDVPTNKIYQWMKGKAVSVFLEPAGYTGRGIGSHEPGSNGLALASDGSLLICEHGDRRISRLPKESGRITVADRYQGKRLNSPNDLAVKSNGDIYFTDPPYGLPRKMRNKLREIDFDGVYRVDSKGEVTLLTKRLTNPNGIAFSPDEKILYIAQSDGSAPVIWKFEVQPDGTLAADGKVLVDFTNQMSKGGGNPDGLKVDQRGNLWATGPGGVWVISPEGKLLGLIRTTQRTANCAWGDDGSVLYITADFYLCRIQTKTKGARWK